METVVYAVDGRKIEVELLDEQEFILEAEKQGTVYSLEEFEYAFNALEIHSDIHIIKIKHYGN